jgi:hypothetical protein
MPTTAGELRELLVESIEKVRDDKMEPRQALAIAALAHQVSLSLQTEANIRSADLHDDMGSLAIGDTRPALPGVAKRLV